MARADCQLGELPDEHCSTCASPIFRSGSKARSSKAGSHSCGPSSKRARFVLPIHFYVSDEWFTPDGTASMAVPFYLTHPRLERLEKAQMLEVEGGEHEWCMRILRHEAGHVIDNVYKLRLRRQRRALFGSSAEPYPEFYDPKPYSKSVRAAHRSRGTRRAIPTRTSPRPSRSG